MRFNDFIKNYKAALELDAQDELIIKRTEEDKTGIRHAVYQDTINNIEIEGSELLIHSDRTGAFTQVVTDKLIKKLAKQSPIISKQQALNNAIRTLGKKICLAGFSV